jgi:ferritin
MPMSTALQRAMNDQIQKEFYASYLYLAMSAWFEERNYDGFAKWMRIQAEEERGHAMRIYDFVLDRGGRVTLEAIPEPAAKWKSEFEVFEAARKHEQMVSTSINALALPAPLGEGLRAQVMLQWFITEQVEEGRPAPRSPSGCAGWETVPLAGFIILDRQLANAHGRPMRIAFSAWAPSGARSRVTWPARSAPGIEPHRRPCGRVCRRDRAEAVATPLEAAREAEMVFTCLPNSPEVEEVLAGQTGLEAGLRQGAVLVDLTSGIPRSRGGLPSGFRIAASTGSMLP